MHCFVRCILASFRLRVPPLKFSSLPSSHAPLLCSSPSLRCSLLPPSPLSLSPSIPTSLPHSFSSSYLPPFPLPPSFTSSLHHSLPLLPPSPTLPLLPPSHMISILPRSFLPPSLPTAVQFNVHRLYVWQAALYCEAPRQACLLEREPTRSKDRSLLSYNIDIISCNANICKISRGNL